MNPSSHPGRLPAGPPLPERLSNMADPAEVARFRASAKTPADKIRLGEHMLRGNPDRIGVHTFCSSNMPRRPWSATSTWPDTQAVSVGRRVWGPWLKGDHPRSTAEQCPIRSPGR